MPKFSLSSYMKRAAPGPWYSEQLLMNDVAVSLVISYYHWEYATVQNELHTQLWATREEVWLYNRLCNWFVRNKICCKLNKSSSCVSCPTQCSMMCSISSNKFRFLQESKRQKPSLFSDPNLHNLSHLYLPVRKIACILAALLWKGFPSKDVHSGWGVQRER